ncbi:MAG: hypothetical protein Q8S73_26020 [Deltaproteobacteria bacterium]|nr:hypothetical protein [Myxococcales bacterium]MDP3217593.1 hypothetical protein [Deltaproteobacteria bacterium]
MNQRLGSLLVLTEDSGRDAHATVVAVLKRMLRLVVDDYQTHQLGFEPRDEAAQRGLRGSRWKSTETRDHADVTTLLRSIATKLGRDDGFVFFHVDGDRPWTERATSENRAKFESIVRSRVHQLLCHMLRIPADEAERRMRRLFVVLPFYSIESWLYQHTDVGVRLCREHYEGRDVEVFEGWRLDRAALDDVVKPKQRVCIRADHNLALTGPGYPAEAVDDAGRSYSATVATLRASDALTRLLDATAGRSAP